MNRRYLSIFLIFLIFLIGIISFGQLRPGIEKPVSTSISLNSLEINIDNSALQSFNITNESFFTAVLHIPYSGYVIGSITYTDSGLKVTFDGISNMLLNYNKTLYNNMVAEVGYYLGLRGVSYSEAFRKAVSALHSSIPEPAVTLIALDYLPTGIYARELAIPMDQFINYTKPITRQDLEKPFIRLGDPGSIPSILAQEKVTLIINNNTIALLNIAGQATERTIPYSVIKMAIHSLYQAPPSSQILPTSPVNVESLPPYIPLYLQDIGSTSTFEEMYGVDVRYSLVEEGLEYAQKLEPLVNASITLENGQPDPLTVKLTYDKIIELEAYTYYVVGDWEDLQTFLNAYLDLMVRGYPGSGAPVYSFTFYMNQLITVTEGNIQAYKWKSVNTIVNNITGVSDYFINNLSILEVKIDRHNVPLYSPSGDYIYPLYVYIHETTWQSTLVRSSITMNLGLTDVLSAYINIKTAYINMNQLSGHELILGGRKPVGGIYTNAIVDLSSGTDIGFIVFYIRNFTSPSGVNYYVVKPLFGIIPPITYTLSDARLTYGTKSVLPFDTSYGTIQYLYFNYSYPLNYSDIWPKPHQIWDNIPLCEFQGVLEYTLRVPESYQTINYGIIIHLPADVQIPISQILRGAYSDVGEAASLLLEALGITSDTFNINGKLIVIKIYLDHNQFKFFENGTFYVKGYIIISPYLSEILNENYGLANESFICKQPQDTLYVDNSTLIIKNDKYLFPANRLVLVTSYNGPLPWQSSSSGSTPAPTATATTSTTSSTTAQATTTSQPPGTGDICFDLPGNSGQICIRAINPAP